MDMKNQNGPRHGGRMRKSSEGMMCPAGAAPGAGPRARRVAALYEWTAAAIFSLICIITAFVFFFRIVGVDGSSMERTLDDRDRLLVFTLSYTPRRGDIVIINRYPDEPLVKRVIAVGGDSVAILKDQGAVVLNGEVLNEGYVQGKTEPNDFGTDTQTVPDGYLMVMGDNREVSKDSRKNDVGYVRASEVIGKVVLRFFPLNKFRFF